MDVLQVSLQWHRRIQACYSMILGFEEAVSVTKFSGHSDFWVRLRILAGEKLHLIF